MRRAVFTSRLMGLLLLAGQPTAALAQDSLQPYQLVRSLQLIQDRIAVGDHAALPMQSKLLEMIDTRLREADKDDFRDPKNFRALLVYGMSGGNPVTVEAAVSRATADARDLALARGVIDYLNGRPAEAIEALKPVDPMAEPSDLGAFLALVKGSLLASDQPAAALVLLDEAKLLGPGTLVEEAALRRSVGIAVAQRDAARFALASTQYVERYLYSPYASQFADSFVSGVIELHMSISQDKLADITSMMDPEREKVIYLRIARRAAIDGLNELSAFASARAEQGRDGNTNQGDPRALLYSSLSTVTSGTIEDVRAKLGKIDRSRLSDGDRALLDAAEAIAGEVVAPPASLPTASSAPAEVMPSHEPEPAAAQTADAAGLPPVEGAVSERPAVAPSGDTVAVAPNAPAPGDAATVLPASAPAAAASTDTSDPTDAAMVKTRRQLDLIDQMLGAAPK
ncbi:MULTISPECIES: chemotaxis protein MotC [unclassified Mesorhizobium]|uniref:chemotaxis protein MotC n=1 Tax=unclassified Mesorhizobium TaxID=325217 RepID=UPI0011276192|nr:MULTISPECIES: chemotaxis protein MotC [unclassified Mesorhizobium]MBZ9952060.1 chemotaxis protein MotC [Mesorhizobium sp. BR1-1-15]TPI54566.1 chemotaxis protein MotC [Mesorhizobium sp. B3-1-1]TPJ59833.1 chemotaxis protein MotC [Mesorhizobium sp. B2-6-1]TPJ69897.1 chemotaxis protein MotC [Mesorhizobium sp. B2-6-7]TPJ82077.1 chemotaxis protein MotC [Mesorhizobium sp. B2-6-3]